MRNLKLLYHFGNTFPEIHDAELISQLYETSHELLIVHNLKVSKVNTKNGTVELLFDIQQLTQVESSNIYVVDLAYFTIECLLVCALSNGIIIKYDMESKTLIDVTEVYSQGIKAMKVSPDNELLVFVTHNDSIYLTDCRLETLMVSSLLEENFGEGEFINVGWGKKETQFHGSEGKEAAKKIAVVEGFDGRTDSALVTWRGDSALFSVGYFHNSVYVFKVFDREGVLQYSSEKQTGIECNFTWRPSGNLIATSQQLPNKYVIAFFEKNGLKHGEFTLPFKKSGMEIKRISWSSDSEVLSIWCSDESLKTSSILLYTVNNYHWYLKYSITLKDEIASVTWDESSVTESGKLLHVLMKNGKYLSYNWVWSIDRSRGKTSQDEALVGVIDGSNFLLTSFKKTVIPPPMAGWTVECDNNINNIIFSPNVSATNYFALLKSNKTLRFYKKSDGNVQYLWEMCLEEHLTDADNCFGEISQILWLTNNIIIGIYRYSNRSKIISIDVSVENSAFNHVNVLDVNDQIIGLSANENMECVVMQTSMGKLIKYSLRDNSVTTLPFHFPEPCSEMDVYHQDNNTYVFGLTSRHRFYINDQEVANSVNSFLVHSDFLLLTTLQHQLLCCPLSNNIAATLSATKNEENTLISSRKLERGSRLVTAVSCDCKVILQLPRGNLEAIQPRPLSLKMIGHFLDNCKYYEAFDIMRKQRINLNLLYDHNPQTFIENISKFITQVKNISWLNLFISDLEDHDVTRVMYSTSYLHRTGAAKCKVEKVKMICQLMRNALSAMNENNKYILPLITTYVKTNDIQDLEKALLLINDIHKGIGSSFLSADEALKYLLYMIPVDKLYDVALGLYDFELVMFVAAKSQKDPKEYVPFLNKLKEMEEHYRHFTIDDFLKRYDSALKNLILCGMERESELIVYIKKHILYKAALKYIDRNDPRYKEVAEIYGNYLMSHRNYKEAGVMYKRCNNLEKALEAFVEDVDWRSAMFIAEALNLDANSIKDVQSKLLVELKERKQYDDALDLLQYNGTPSVNELIDCCLEGHLYRKVIGIAAKYKCLEQLESTVLPVALEHYSSLLSTIIQNEDQFIKQKSRLLVVRQNKKEREEVGEEVMDDCDLYSDTSSIMTSNASRSTNRTFRSSKNRRKHERKLMSLKEGSKFEDLALIRSLHILITNTFELQRGVNEISFLLQWLNKDQEMLNLQNSLDKVLLQMSNGTGEIWTADLWAESSNPKPENDLNVNCLQDELANAASSLEPHLKVPPIVQKINWKLQALCL